MPVEITETKLEVEIRDRVEQLELDLSQKVVLTEAANGAYSATALIAAVAGAEVYAFTRPTSYGTVEEVFNFMRSKMALFSNPKIHLIDSLTPEIIHKADIITNSGHLRPLNKEKLQHVKKGAVISLMYEDWELRNSDIDVDYCKANNIPIGAVNERHTDVDVFGYLGDMAIKLILDAGLCLYRRKFVLICNNDFGPYIAKTLSKVCSKIGVIGTLSDKELYRCENIDWLSDFPNINISSEYSDSEAIILSASPFTNIWIGEDTLITPTQLYEDFRHPLILRFIGDVNTDILKKNNIRYYPETVSSGHMGVIPSDIGYDSVIRLQAGGLKAGQALLEKNYYHNSDIICKVIQ